MNPVIRTALRNWINVAHHLKETRQWGQLNALRRDIRIWYARRHWSQKKLAIYLGYSGHPPSEPVGWK